MKKEIIIGGLLVVGVIGFLLYARNDFKQESTEVQEVTKEITTEESNNTYTMEQVSLKDSQDECWVVVNSKVYDVTSIIETHPGGTKPIINNCGKEATQVFETQGGNGEHSQEAKNTLETLLVGELNE